MFRILAAKHNAPARAHIVERKMKEKHTSRNLPHPPLPNTKLIIINNNFNPPLKHKKHHLHLPTILHLLNTTQR